MVINQSELLLRSPIRNMEPEKIREHGVSYGLGEAGYDIRIKQRIVFHKLANKHVVGVIPNDFGDIPNWSDGRFAIASAIEEFDMPDDLVGIVHDKSTWARKGLSVFNTVIEPGWKGFLTLELVYHGNENLVIPAGAGIAQVVFHQTFCKANYTGKYQFQEDEPVQARES